MVYIYKRINRRIKSLFGFYLKQKYLYLTFDDGPTKGTNICLESCISNKIPASFFWVGLNFKKNNGIKIKSILETHNLNFLIGNHSYSHGYGNYKSFYQDEAIVFSDFIKNHEELNLSNKFCRLPGRNSWYTNSIKQAPTSLINCCEKLSSEGFFIYGWDIEWEYNKDQSLKLATNSTEMLSLTIEKMRKGFCKKQNHLVLLLHDWTFSTSESKIELDNFIVNAIKKGFKFKTIKEYPN